MSKWLWYSAGAILFLSYGYTEMQGSDLWWHIAAGREIIQTKTLWMVDDWSFSSHGAIWRNHEWLADIIYYGWAHALGVASLVYWKWLVVIATFVILQQVCHRISGSFAASLVCAGAAIAIAAPFIDVRPHLYTLLCFSVLLLLLLNRQPVLWKLALLFVVWVNLHGGFFFGLMALGILIFPWRNFSLETFKPAFFIGLACVAVCLLNPSGIHNFLYPLTYAFDSSSPFKTLGEWLPPSEKGGIRSPIFFWAQYLAPLIALSYLVPFVRRASGIPWEGIALSALTLAMAITSRRFIPLFAMSMAVMSAPLLGLLLVKLNEEKSSIGLGVAALCFAVYRLMPYPLSSGAAYHYLTAEYTYPIDMVDFMRTNNIKGNVYALYNWGGYLHWRTDGDLKVFIDGRADTIYNAETYLGYVDVLRNVPGWLGQIERSGAEYVLWPNVGYGGSRKGNELIKSGRWQFIYQDSVSFLMAKKPLVKNAEYIPAPVTPYTHLGLARLQAMQGNYESAVALATQTREAIPYQNGACNVLIDSYRALGDLDRANATIRDCRSYFPSNHLRR
ncbi:MAG: tetratricopeptide repeat protein [Halioglobus sp.]